MVWTSSSDSEFSIRSSRPGTLFNSARKIKCSLCSLSASKRYSVITTCRNTWRSKTLLRGESIVRLVWAFAHSNYAIIDQCVDITKGMNGSAKMAAMMHEWVRRAPIFMLETWTNLHFKNRVTYGFFLGPSWRASWRLFPNGSGVLWFSLLGILAVREMYAIWRIFERRFPV